MTPKDFKLSRRAFFCSALLFLMGFGGSLLLPSSHLIEPMPASLPVIKIFLTNMLTAAKMLLGGLTFGLLTGWYLFTAGMFIGTSFNSLILKNKLLGFMLGVMPHGVFEFTGIVLAGSAGFEIAHFLKGIVMEEAELKESRTHIKKMIFYLLMVILLIGIGSLIESKITPDLIRWGLENGKI